MKYFLRALSTTLLLALHTNLAHAEADSASTPLFQVFLGVLELENQTGEWRDISENETKLKAIKNYMFVNPDDNKMKLFFSRIDRVSKIKLKLCSLIFGRMLVRDVSHCIRVAETSKLPMCLHL